MSKIEDEIRAEQQTAKQKSEAKEAAAAAKAARGWSKWVEEEKPRIAQFKRKINKEFPCLKGDFKVEPRRNATDFVAIVTVDGTPLRIKLLDKKYNLFIPYDERNPWGYGWEEKYTQLELKDDADLKRHIKNYLVQREYEHQRAEREWDSRPIGNTD